MTVFGLLWRSIVAFLALPTVYAACIAIAFHLRVVFYEEPWQARTFGEEWRAYRERVPRWIGLRGASANREHRAT